MTTSCRSVYSPPNRVLFLRRLEHIGCGLRSHFRKFLGVFLAAYTDVSIPQSANWISFSRLRVSRTVRVRAKSLRLAGRLAVNHSSAYSELALKELIYGIHLPRIRARVTRTGK